jgi:hypothetical protein
MRLFHYSLSDGQRGTWQTIDAMVKLCHEAVLDEQVRQAALAICAPVAGHDFDGEVRRLYEWVRDNVTFRRDPLNVERVQTPINTLNFKTGDCDDQALLLAALLSSLGHPCQFIVQAADGETPDHVYLEAALGNQWVSLDPIAEDKTFGWRHAIPPGGCEWECDIWNHS